MDPDEKTKALTRARAPRLFYLRDKQRRPVGAFAFVIEPADQTAVAWFSRLMEHRGASPEAYARGVNSVPLHAGYAIRFTVTLCRPGDNFSKEVARTRTLGRLQSMLRCALVMPRPDAFRTPARAPDLDLRAALPAIRFPRRDDIDYDAMNALLERMVQQAHAAAMEIDPNPPCAERPQLPKPAPKVDDDDDDDDLTRGPSGALLN